ncbi:MAG: tRNA epoxyqueuosine(34) reductase QueG [Bacteroidota bacterium]
MATDNLSDFIKKSAVELGFSQCGISPVMDSSKDIQALRLWISKKYHADMAWIESSIPLRENPELLLSEIKSVVVVTLNYYTENQLLASEYKVSKFAQNLDYHNVLKSKLYQLLTNIKSIDATIDARVFVDSGPIFEKSYAVNAGLGWIGKNSCLIMPKQGSFFFIGVLLLTVELDFDNPFDKSYCANCTRCIDACPTGAISAPYTINSNRCISYLTIEHHDDIPENIDFKSTNQIFGCDICQQVCPHNKFSQDCLNPDFTPSKELLSMTTIDWESLDKSSFKKQFKHSPIQRAGYQKIMSNIANIKNKRDEI